MTTTVFGIAEQVTRGVGALTFEPGDVHALVAHLGRLLDLPSERHRLAEGAYAASGLITSYEEMVQEYEFLFIEAFVAGGERIPGLQGMEAPRRRVVASGPHRAIEPVPRVPSQVRGHHRPFREDGTGCLRP